MMILLLAPLTARLHKLRAPTEDGILLMMTTAKETMLLEAWVAPSVEPVEPVAPLVEPAVPPTAALAAAPSQAHTGEQYDRAEYGLNGS